MRAVVDIGSNSVKYLLAQPQRLAADSAFPWDLVAKGYWVTRLGRGMKEKGGRLDAQAVAETRKAFVEMKAAWAAKGAPHPEVKIVATSAVRDAANPQVIAEAVREIFGSQLRILSGEEEAYFSTQGANLAATKLFPETHPLVLIDVGGASTEVSTEEGGFWAHSFQAGAVRCHEALGLAQIPVPDEVWHKAQSAIENFFPEPALAPLQARLDARPPQVLAIGGSLVLAAKLCGARAEAEGAGYWIERAELDRFNDRLRRMSLSERLQLPGMEPGRADVLCAGLLCLRGILQRLRPARLAITSWGLRYGILRAWDQVGA